MNYLEQIKNFWQKDAQHGFSDKEIAFYFYLLSVSNSQRWQNPFGLSNNMVAAKFGWGRHALNNIKNNLKQAGLIDYEAGIGRGNIYQYELLKIEKTTKTASATEKKTKDENKELILPYHSPQFVQTWNTLLQMPKWRDKPQSILQANLDRLKQYDEAFATQLIEHSTLGNWQGLIFKDTDSQYKKWIMEQSKTYGSSNTVEDRKTEIMRRATLAAATCNR